MRLADKGLRQGRIDAQQQATLAAGADGHLSVDQEGQATEHAFFSQAELTLDDASWRSG